MNKYTYELKNAREGTGLAAVSIYSRSQYSAIAYAARSASWNSSEDSAAESAYAARCSAGYTSEGELEFQINLVMEIL